MHLPYFITNFYTISSRGSGCSSYSAISFTTSTSIHVHTGEIALSVIHYASFFPLIIYGYKCFSHEAVVCWLHNVQTFTRFALFKAAEMEGRGNGSVDGHAGCSTCKSAYWAPLFSAHRNALLPARLHFSDTTPVTATEREDIQYRSSKRNRVRETNT